MGRRRESVRRGPLEVCSLASIENSARELAARHLGLKMKFQQNNLCSSAAAAFVWLPRAPPLDKGAPLDAVRPADQSGASSNSSAPSRRPEAKELEQFLRSLPVLSVAERRSAHFECDLGAGPQPGAPEQLVWLRLLRDELTVLSLNRKLISPDRRLRVAHQPPRRWTLTLERVSELADDGAYFLCQSARESPAGGFIGGAQLDVLGKCCLAFSLLGPRLRPTRPANQQHNSVPPKLVDQETSANLVSANEFEPLKLSCKVRSQPNQAQITWRREDGQPIDGLEQRFRHQLERLGGGLVASLDSAELLIERVERGQAGAYLVSRRASFAPPQGDHLFSLRLHTNRCQLCPIAHLLLLFARGQCIASNGVQPGVSQRILVTVHNCRQSEHWPPGSESCEPNPAGQQSESASSPTSPSSPPNATAGPTQAPPWARAKTMRKSGASTWTLDAGRARASSNANGAADKGRQPARGVISAPPGE